MEKKVDVAIIGAGSAGLSAYREVARVTNNFVIIQGGPSGTTCARVGCMPSKALIQVANDYYRRKVFKQIGILGANHLDIDIKQVMRHVRSLRDRFVGGVLKSIEKIQDKVISGYAEFEDIQVLKVEKHTIRAERIIIATGSRPIVPKHWQKFGKNIITSDDIFELDQFPKDIGVVGMGIIGMELGQALSRFNLNITGINRSERICGLTDPELSEYAFDLFGQEMHLVKCHEADVSSDGPQFTVSADSKHYPVDAVLATLGRSPNFDHLNLECLEIERDEDGFPIFDPSTMQIANLPLFIAGDINGDRLILHEAADEGRIAGYNAVRNQAHCFERRTKLAITFCEPNVAIVGQSYADLKGKEIVVGEASFEDQGRSRVMIKNKGRLRVYGDGHTGALLGAELIAPHGEHLAHLLAWVISQKLTVVDVLQMPFYHPVVEEGLRTALRDLARKIKVGAVDFELAMCESEAADTLN